MFFLTKCCRFEEAQPYQSKFSLYILVYIQHSNSSMSATTVSLPDWVISLDTNPNSLLAATSKGTIHQLSLDPLKWTPQTAVEPVHRGTIHKVLTTPSDPFTAYTVSDDSTIKIWDLRKPFTTSSAVHTLTNSRNLPFFSLTVNHGKLAAGSQLKGVDSELVLFDLKKLDTPLRSFIDSHNDDITITKFHPTKRNYLLSGATDGYVNIYNLDVVDEDDAMVQCITFDSVHSADWLSDGRIGVLSHMETFGVFNMSTESDLTGESTETKNRGDLEYGDVREKWGCEYVVDFYAPGYVVGGKNSIGELSVRRLDPVAEVVGDVLWKGDGWHDGEVVRDWRCHNGVAYSGGEDGKIWSIKCDLEDSRDCFFGENEKEKMDKENDNEEQEMEVEFDLKKKDKTNKKDKKLKREKKKEKKHRFKPY